MKVRLLFILLLALLLPAPSALAGEDNTTDPDAARRWTLRLCDLGYLTIPAEQVSDEALAAGLNAFYEANALTEADAMPEKLFSRNAKPAPFPGGGIALEEAPLCTGSATPWTDVKQRLVPGEAYAVTDCGTGAVCYLICGERSGHVVMTPSRDWDASLLAGLLGERNPFAKRPVVLSLGKERIAASLEPEPGEAAVAYGLFFTGGIAGLSGIADAGRAATLAYTAGEP